MATLLALVERGKSSPNPLSSAGPGNAREAECRMRFVHGQACKELEIENRGLGRFE